MSSSPIPHLEPSRTGFRLALLAFAVIVGLGSVCVLAAEFTHFAGHPIANDASPPAPTPRTTACVAARLAFVRGDLWTECALMIADPFRTKVTTGQESDSLGQARGAAERAVVLAPHDATAWLILANLDSRFDWVSRRTAALKMSYYTGSNETALIPWRLATFGRLEGSTDEDLQQLVRHELTNVVNHKPDLKWAIVAAYHEALPTAKDFFATVLQEIDPKLLATMRP